MRNAGQKGELNLKQMSSTAVSRADLIVAAVPDAKEDWKGAARHWKCHSGVIRVFDNAATLWEEREATLSISL